MQTKFGISAALLTPFKDGHAVDSNALISHARRMLRHGVTSVTPFGTTGEGASIGADEKQSCLNELVSAGIPPQRIVLGIFASAAEDAVAQIACARALGVDTFLVSPPFFFKDCSDAGLFDWHMQVISRCDPVAKVILYNVPQVTGVPLSVGLVARLAAAQPGRIRAIKDSSGDWTNSKALLDNGSVPVLVGDERQLHKAAAQGAAGSICGFSNLYPSRMVKLFETATEDTELSEEVARVVSEPVVPALKFLMAAQSGNPTWERVRPPLTQLSAAAKEKLLPARVA